MSNIDISPQSGVIEFNTGSAGISSFMTSTAPIRLDATGGNVWFTGSNVGIGTTDPQAKLDVSGAFRSVGIAYLNSDVQVGGDQIIFTNDAASAYIQAADALYIESDYDNDDSENKPIFFRTSAVERMRIAGNGSVGIGTTNAVQKLTVKGTIVHTNASNVQVAGMTNSSDAGRLYANNAGGVTNVLLDSNGDSYL